MNVETSLVVIFLYFLLSGAVLGFVYELLRMFRLVLPHSSIVIGAEDTLFLTLCGIFLFGLSMEAGNGEFRLLFLISAVVGALLYHFTVGRIVRMVYVWVLRFVRKVLSLIYRKTLKPFANIFVRIALKISHPFVERYKNVRKKMEISSHHLKYNSEMLYNNNIVKVKGDVKSVGKTRIKAKIKKDQ